MFFLFRFFYLTVLLWIGFVMCARNFDSDFDGITLDYSRQRATPGTMDKLYNLAEVNFEWFFFFFLEFLLPAHGSLSNHHVWDVIISPSTFS